jgi:Fe-S cluster assembly protein SufD
MNDVIISPALLATASATAARLAPGLAWLDPLREDSLRQFGARGLPTTADEDWRYTDLRETGRRMAIALEPPPVGPDARAQRQIDTRLIPDTGIAPILLIDGRLAVEAPGRLPPGLTIRALSAVDREERERLAARLSRDHDRALGALNTALLLQGVVIDIAPGTDLTTPLYVVCAATTDRATHNRILIRLGDNSRVTLIEHHLGLAAGVSNTATDIACEAGSRIDYIKIQDDSPAARHLAAQSLELGENAHATTLHLDLGAELARNDLHVVLAGRSAHVEANGLFFADGTRHLDNHTRIEHRAPDTVSRELYRGVLDDKGCGVFNGKVIVHAGAGGTDARLNNQNLLLSPGAQVNTKPELEIYADDVRCSHGATTGALDTTAIFYLRSRGIGAIEARRMLIASFAQEIIRRLPVDGCRHYAVHRLAERLPEIREVAGEP